MTTPVSHSHEFDDELPLQLNSKGNPYPYMCRACEAQAGDPYAWVEAALAKLNAR